MTCRRKLKADRELLADLKKRTKSICYCYENCSDCIIEPYTTGTAYFDDCIQGYVRYLLSNKNEERVDD